VIGQPWPGAYFEKGSRTWDGPVLFEVDRPLARFHVDMHPGPVSERKITIHYPAADEVVAAVGWGAFSVLLWLLRNAQETPDGLIYPAGAAAIGTQMAAKADGGRRHGWGEEVILGHLKVLRGRGLVRYLVRPLSARRRDTFYEMPPTVWSTPTRVVGTPQEGSVSGPEIPGSGGSVQVSEPGMTQVGTTRPVVSGSGHLGSGRSGSEVRSRGGSLTGSGEPGSGHVGSGRSRGPDNLVVADESSHDDEVTTSARALVDVAEVIVTRARAVGWKGKSTRPLTVNPARTLAWLTWLAGQDKRNSGGYLASMLAKDEWPSGYPADLVAGLVGDPPQVGFLLAGRPWTPPPPPGGDSRLSSIVGGNGPAPGAGSATSSVPGRWSVAAVADRFAQIGEDDPVEGYEVRRRYQEQFQAAKAAGVGSADAVDRAARAVLGPAPAPGAEPS
jgi:hypothetical protein